MGYRNDKFFSHTNPYISNVTQQCRCSPMLIFRAWLPVGYSTKYFTGRLRPEVQPMYRCSYVLSSPEPLGLICNDGLWGREWPLTLFFSPFLREKVPHSPSLKCEWTTKPERFLDFFTAIRCISVSPFGPFYDRNDRFSYPSMYLDFWDPYPFIYLKPEKGTPFGRSLSV